MDAAQGAGNEREGEAGFCRDASVGRARHQAPDLRSDFDGSSVRYDVIRYWPRSYGQPAEGHDGLVGGSDLVSTQIVAPPAAAKPP